MSLLMTVLAFLKALRHGMTRVLKADHVAHARANHFWAKASDHDLTGDRIDRPDQA